MSLTLTDAEQAIAAALAEARAAEMEPLGVAILDGGGHLVAFKREDGATMLRFDIARAKAWTALSLGSSSRAFQEMAAERPGFAASLNSITDGAMAASAGGLLLEKGGEIVGAIGISGDTPDRDERAAAAGVRAL